MLIKKTFSCRPALFIPVSFLLFFSINPPTFAAEAVNIEFLKKEAYRDCTKLDKTISETCIDAINYRFRSLERFLKKHDKYITSAIKTYEKELEKFQNKYPKKKLREIAKKGYPRRKQIQRHAEGAKISALLRHIQSITIEQAKTQARFEQSVINPSRIFLGTRAETKYICKLRDTARIECVSIAAVLSEYNNETGNLILSDIDRLHDVFGMDFSNPVLFACGPGVWGNMGVPQSGLSNFESYMADSGFDSILNKCSQITDALSSGSAQSYLNSGGFSGISGLDPLGLMGMCGLEVSGSDADEFTANALQHSADMHQDCASTLRETMMETIEDVDLPNKKDGDGKKLETATEIIQNGDGTETVTDVDADGNMVTFTRDSTQDHDSITVKYDDGSSGHTDVYATGDTHTRNTTSDNVTTHDYSATDADGDRHTWTEDENGNTIDENIELGNTKLPHLMNKFKSACAGEPCSSCYNFNQLNPKLEAAGASGNAEDLWILRNFSRVADCCSNEAIFPGDPRLVVPDPQGDFICTGGVDNDLLQEMCQSRCSLAYSEDCTSNCSSFSDRNSGFDFTLLDHVCRYSRNEACFVRDGGLPIPDPSPIPTPELIPEEAIFLNPFLPKDYGLEYGAGIILKDQIIPIVPDP